jgi:hypothetical protein
LFTESWRINPATFFRKEGIIYNKTNYQYNDILIPFTPITRPVTHLISNKLKKIRWQQSRKRHFFVPHACLLSMLLAYLHARTTYMVPPFVQTAFRNLSWIWFSRIKTPILQLEPSTFRSIVAQDKVI